MSSVRMIEVMQSTEYITLETIQEVVKRECITHYAYVLHDKDLDDNKPKQPHYHIMLKFRSPQQMDAIAKWFGVKENYLQKIKKWGSCITYLSHENAEDKHQYSREEITANFDVNKVIDDNKNSRDKKLDQVIDMIMDGTINEFNLDEFVSVKEETIWKKFLLVAFARRSTQLLKGVRNMETVFIYGDSGAGKSTLAYKLASDKGYDVFRSSSSNDVLDGYKGQKCIILDDLRSSSISFSDFLKLADNHFPSSVKSRYNNKVLDCKLLIVTAINNINDFYNGMTDRDEPMKQLRRRFGHLVRMQENTVTFFSYNQMDDKYDFVLDMANTILTEVKKKERKTEEEQILDIKTMFAGSIKELNDIENGHPF